MPEEKALQFAATYLGSLPPRPRSDATLPPLRQVAGFTGPLERMVDVETITPRAHPIVLWRAPHWQDVRGRRLMSQAVRILESRVRQELREDRGLTYSASTYVNPSRVYPAVSALYVEFTTDPEKVAEAVALVRTIVERFAAEGPTEEEVETARRQFVNIFDTTIKDPRFWGNLLSDLEYHETKLEDIDGVVGESSGLYERGDCRGSTPYCASGALCHDYGTA
jgi:zinc protease